MILVLSLILLLGFLIWLWSSFSPPEHDPLDPREGYKDDYGSCPVCGTPVRNGQYQCGCLWRQ